jgi:hypothetical protein
MFARRSIQSFLNALEPILNPYQLISLVDRLNLNNRDSVAAEWEICVLFSLMHLGRVTYEPALIGKSCPDIFFCRTLPPTYSSSQMLPSFPMLI